MINSSYMFQANVQLYSDGGARGNPGPAGYGFVIQSKSPSGAVKFLKKCGDYLGETTNNQAEYHGLLAGLRWLLDHQFQAANLQIFLDSLLVVNQLTGKFKVKHPRLKPLWQQARTLLSQFSSSTIHHIPRHQNSLADHLANLAMDQRGRVEID